MKLTLIKYNLLFITNLVLMIFFVGCVSTAEVKTDKRLFNWTVELTEKGGFSGFSKIIINSDGLISVNGKLRQKNCNDIVVSKDKRDDILQLLNAIKMDLKEYKNLNNIHNEKLKIEYKEIGNSHNCRDCSVVELNVMIDGDKFKLQKTNYDRTKPNYIDLQSLIWTIEKETR